MPLTKRSAAVLAALVDLQAEDLAKLDAGTCRTLLAAYTALAKHQKEHGTAVFAGAAEAIRKFAAAADECHLDAAAGAGADEQSAYLRGVDDGRKGRPRAPEQYNYAGTLRQHYVDGWFMGRGGAT